MIKFSSFMEFRQSPEKKGAIEMCGFLLEMNKDWGISTGDSYIAERNTGPHFLTCREHNKEMGVVFPLEIAYAFDTGECVRVVSVDGEKV